MSAETDNAKADFMLNNNTAIVFVEDKSGPGSVTA
jgi:hypothetical protein